jgi:DNA-binding NarL/FixJ family response regulator
VLRSVLVVDDSSFIRQKICELFTRDGEFNVCGEAENGREAIKNTKQLHPDLIITDLSMPVMNGLEETRLLKQILPTVPVIIYSSYIDLFLEREARLAGASAAVSKSEKVTALLEIARGLFEDQIAA